MLSEKGRVEEELVETGADKNIGNCESQRNESETVLEEQHHTGFSVHQGI